MIIAVTIIACNATNFSRNTIEKLMSNKSGRINIPTTKASRTMSNWVQSPRPASLLRRASVISGTECGRSILTKMAAVSAVMRGKGNSNTGPAANGLASASR